MILQRFLLPLLALAIAGCDSDRASTPVPMPEPEPEPIPQFDSCMAVSIDQAVADLSFTLPANFIVDSYLEINQTPRSPIVFFDDLSGEIRLQSSSSRLPQTIEYSLLNADGDVIETHQHSLVYSQLRIMPLGDSITHGIDFFETVGLPEVGLRVGYRLSLYDQLTADSLSFDFVGQAGQRAGLDAGLPDPDNNGYPGVDIDFIFEKLTEIIEQGSPDIVLLHIGTNQTPSNAQGIDDILDRLASLSTSDKPIQVFVATLTPKRDAEQQQTVAAFNNDLRQRFQDGPERNAILVEIAQALTAADISSEPIGIHPNSDGYLKMADAWYQAMGDASVLETCNGG